MQQIDTIMYPLQGNATLSIIDQHEGCSILSKQLLLENDTQANSATTSTIILNCIGLESINSHGICLLLKLLIYCRRQQKRLQVYGLSEHNRYIFEITRLSKFIDIVSTKPQAVATIHTNNMNR